MELKLAFVGFGNVARAFGRMLVERRASLLEEHGLRWRTTAIATATHGNVISHSDLDLLNATRLAEQGESLTSLEGAFSADDPIQTIERCNADIMIETTPLDPQAGEPAISHIRLALSRGLSVVTANKGPLAFAYHQLRQLARAHGAFFRFEGAVMDGTPIFNLVEDCLPGAKILGFSGVLNSTTNLILSGMESGRTFNDCLAEAQRLGIAEANAEFDIDGWDAAIKAAALANVLMGADVRPADVTRQGIRLITSTELAAAAEKKRTVRLVARAHGPLQVLRVGVMPEKVPLSSPLALVQGTSNVLILETDLMGELSIIENNPGVEQTAYALLSDLMRVNKDLSRPLEHQQP